MSCHFHDLRKKKKSPAHGSLKPSPSIRSYPILYFFLDFEKWIMNGRCVKKIKRNLLRVVEYGDETPTAMYNPTRLRKSFGTIYSSRIKKSGRIFFCRRVSST